MWHPEKPLGNLDYTDLTNQRDTYYSLDYRPFNIQRVTLGHGNIDQEQPSYELRDHINQHLT